MFSEVMTLCWSVGGSLDVVVAVVAAAVVVVGDDKEVGACRVRLPLEPMRFVSSLATTVAALSMLLGLSTDAWY